MKTLVFDAIDTIKEEVIRISDFIFDNPEPGLEENKASEKLTDYLERNGFAVERGVGGIPTAFRAVFENGTSGPSIGLLCEYDALKDIGHACGHHMQGPAIAAAAIAVKSVVRDHPYRLVVYGTPAEESVGGKIIMLKNGCFLDIDLALMTHAAPATTTDVRCLALSSFIVTFRGVSSHAAVKPEDGRSALDALLLAFHGIEHLREHVREDTRMHYTVTNAGGPDNIVPGLASGTFTLRSFNRHYLDSVVARFRNIIQGAALMTETEYDIQEESSFDNKIPVLSLNDLLMKNAEELKAPCIRPPREKTGSTDFGNVMHKVPGSCIRVAFVDEDTPPHSQAYLDSGKSDRAHAAVLTAARILAASCLDIISDPAILSEIREEFAKNKAALSDY